MGSRRQMQVAEMIKRHFSIVLQQEGHYIYDTDVLVSVTNVVMSPDLGLAKIYVSIFNTENKTAVMQLINESKHRLKNQLTQRVRKHVRRIPDIDIYIDDTLDEMYKLNQLFDGINTDENN